MEKNKFQNIINFILKYGIIIVSIIIGIIGISSIFITAYFNSTFYHPAEKTLFKYSFGIIEILLSIMALFILGVVSKKVLKKVPSSILLIPICIISLAVYILWINAMKLNPETDQKLIHEMAIAFLDGKISSFTGISQYLFLYPYQFGITFVVSIIYKIFGQNYLYVEYLNAICSILNIILIFYISKILFKNENVQKILSLLLCGFSLYWMFFNVHFYGNIIGLTLALLATLFAILYLEKNNLKYLLFSGILISISIIVKTNYNIFLCGIILILLLKIIESWNLKTLLIIPMFLIGYLGISLSYNTFFENISNLKLSNGVPMISFIYMGMSEPTDLSPGWYNGITADIFRECNYDIQKASNESKDLINKRINYFVNNPKDFSKYYSEKIGSTWLNPTFQTIWCSLPGVRYRWYEDYANYISYHAKALSMVGGNLEKIEEEYFNIYQIIAFVFASIGIFKLSKNLDLKKSLLPIIFIGGFLFHILWETKAIYVIQYYFILLPYTAFGIEETFQKINSYFEKIKIKRKQKA